MFRYKTNECGGDLRLSSHLRRHDGPDGRPVVGVGFGGRARVRPKRRARGGDGIGSSALRRGGKEWHRPRASCRCHRRGRGQRGGGETARDPRLRESLLRQALFARGEEPHLPGSPSVESDAGTVRGLMLRALVSSSFESVIIV